MLHPKIIIFKEQTTIPDTFVSGIVVLNQMGFLDSLIDTDLPIDGVRYHLQRIYRKLEINSKAELIAIALF